MSLAESFALAVAQPPGVGAAEAAALALHEPAPAIVHISQAVSPCCGARSSSPPAPCTARHQPLEKMHRRIERLVAPYRVVEYDVDGACGRGDSLGHSRPLPVGLGGAVGQPDARGGEAITHRGLVADVHGAERRGVVLLNVLSQRCALEESGERVGWGGL